MALSGFPIPDHSTIAAFVSRSPERLESLFVQIVMECDYLGLIGGDVFAIDGSKISSNVSKDWSGTKADFECKYKKIRRAVRRMLVRHREEDAQDRVDVEVWLREEKQIEKLRQVSRKLNQPVPEMEDRLGHAGKPNKSNLTDPDSVTMMSGGSGCHSTNMWTTALNTILTLTLPTTSPHQVIHKGRAENPAWPLDLMKDKIDSVKGRVIYSDRIGIIEPVFVHIKHTLGLDWFSCVDDQRSKCNGCCGV